MKRQPGLPSVTGRVAYGSPTWLVEKICNIFGGKIDLDPAGDHDRILPGVVKTLFEDSIPDGLSRPWKGNVFVNPPYGEGLDAWFVNALESHVQGANVILLCPSNTSRGCWGIATFAASIYFHRGRITFHGEPNCAAFSSTMILWSDIPTRDRFEKEWRDHGLIVRPA